MNLLKKSLSGSMGKNLIDILFSTQLVAESDVHRLLMALRDSKLKDGEIRQTFFQTVIDSLDMGEQLPDSAGPRRLRRAPPGRGRRAPGG